MTFQPIRKRSYRGPDGLMCDQSEAVGPDGIVKSGYSVSIGVMAADSVPPGMTIVLDTDAAHAGYVSRMTTKRAAPRPTDAPPVAAPGEGTAHSDYVRRMARRANKEA
jgi:hypothetical protein